MALSETEVRSKVSAALRDMVTGFCDRLGREIPTDQWDEVTPVLRSMGEDDLADAWEEGND